MLRASDNSAFALQRLWWLQPALLFALVVGGTFGAAAMTSDAGYRLYGTPKYITAWHCGLAFTAIVAFALGYQLAQATGTTPRATPRHVHSAVRIAFWIATLLTFIGYAAWMLVAMRNGLTLGMLREFLTTDDPEVWETLSKEVFVSWKGVTTASQFAIAAVPLGMWLVFQGERRLIWPVGMLLALAAVRAVAFSERLAIIELLVPIALIGLRISILGQPLSKLKRQVLQLAPVLGVLGLFVFFGASEYLRSWRYYQHEFDSFTSFTLWRMAGYYSTAHNNGAMAMETQPPYPLPYATTRAIWLIPGLSQTPLGYQKITGIDPSERHEQMLEQFGTPELNNEGGLFQPALDFGVGGYLLFWLASGFVSGRLYRHYLVGTLAGLTLYPLIIIAVLETPRFLYLCYTRSFPGLVMLAIVLWWVHRPAAYEASGAPAFSTG
jgi:hypothetical protein